MSSARIRSFGWILFKWTFAYGRNVPINSAEHFRMQFRDTSMICSVSTNRIECLFVDNISHTIPRRHAYSLYAITGEFSEHVNAFQFIYY